MPDWVVADVVVVAVAVDDTLKQMRVNYHLVHMLCVVIVRECVEERERESSGGGLSCHEEKERERERLADQYTLYTAACKTLVLVKTPCQHFGGEAKERMCIGRKEGLIIAFKGLDFVRRSIDVQSASQLLPTVPHLVLPCLSVLPLIFPPPSSTSVVTARPGFKLPPRCLPLLSLSSLSLLSLSPLSLFPPFWCFLIMATLSRGPRRLCIAKP